jgi:hypothetical protein
MPHGGPVNTTRQETAMYHYEQLVRGIMADRMREAELARRSHAVARSRRSRGRLAGRRARGVAE